MISPSTPTARGIQITWPVARCAVQEQAAAGVDGRTQAVQHPLVDQQVLEGGFQVVHRRVLLREGLGPHALDVFFQRHRRSPEVRAVLRVPAGPLAADLRELVLVIVHRRGAGVDHELIGLHLPHQLVDHLEGEPHLVGHVSPAGRPAGQEQLDDQRLDLALRDLGLPEGLRLRWQELLRERLCQRGGLGLRRRSLRFQDSRVAGQARDALEDLLELLVLVLAMPGRRVLWLGRGHRGPGRFFVLARARQTRQKVLLRGVCHSVDANRGKQREAPRSCQATLGFEPARSNVAGPISLVMAIMPVDRS
jgi:hypothetical protein